MEVRAKLNRVLKNVGAQVRSKLPVVGKYPANESKILKVVGATKDSNGKTVKLDASESSAPSGEGVTSPRSPMSPSSLHSEFEAPPSSALGHLAQLQAEVALQRSHMSTDSLSLGNVLPAQGTEEIQAETFDLLAWFAAQKSEPTEKKDEKGVERRAISKESMNSAEGGKKSPKKPDGSPSSAKKAPPLQQVNLFNKGSRSSGSAPQIEVTDADISNSKASPSAAALPSYKSPSANKAKVLPVSKQVEESARTPQRPMSSNSDDAMSDCEGRTSSRQGDPRESRSSTKELQNPRQSISRESSRASEMGEEQRGGTKESEGVNVEKRRSSQLNLPGAVGSTAGSASSSRASSRANSRRSSANLGGAAEVRNRQEIESNLNKRAAEEQLISQLSNLAERADQIVGGQGSGQSPQNRRSSLQGIREGLKALT